MRLRPPTSSTLTEPVADQLRSELADTSREDPFLVTTRWGWIAGPPRTLTDEGDPYEVAVYLHRPTNVLSDAARADRNHMSVLRYFAGGVIVVPVLVALLWMLYVPVVALAGPVAGFGVGWAMWQWLRPKVTVAPIERAPMLTVEAEPTTAGIIAAVRSVPFVQVLDDLGTSLPPAGDSDEQYVTAWKAEWETYTDAGDTE